MARLKAIFGTVWAAAALPVLLVMFFGLGRWPALLVGATGLHVSPWYSGGPRVSSVTRDGYTVHLHNPVFDGLVGQRDTGFVQVDIVPPEGGRLPATIEETVTPAGNSALAFALRVDTATPTATVVPAGNAVLGLGGVWVLDRGLAVRVTLRNPR